MKKENKLRYECKILLQNLMKIVGYEKKDMFIGRSIIFDCSFYQTEFPNIVITDFDISTDLPLNDKTFFAVNIRTGNRFRFTAELLEQAKEAFKSELAYINA